MNVFCLDQSGSMGVSVVYSGLFGSILASIPAVQTRMVVFDTAVVDLTDDLQDPVDLLFGVQLGGDTVLVLVTDLYEGASQQEMRKKMVSACTPDKFPDLMARATAKQDIRIWLSKNML